jgi:hypothetical protein
MNEGFLVGKHTDPNVYAVIPYGNSQFMVIHKGEQVKICRTEQSARNFISRHRKGLSVSELPL